MRRRRAVYRSLTERARRRSQDGDFDECLLSAYAAAQAAYLHHFGIWSDPDLDALLAEIAPTMAGDLDAPRPRGGNGSGPRIVHLVSVLRDTGGHTQVVRQWAEAMRPLCADQAIVSSELEDSTRLGPSARSALAGTMSEIRLCPRRVSGAERVRWTAARLVELCPDHVVLHVDPADAYAITALQAARTRIAMRPIFFTHADHVFNLGADLAERVVLHRELGAQYSYWYRGIPPDRMRIVPLVSNGARARPVDRGSLGIPKQATVSISVGSYYKFMPDAHWNYGAILARLLEAEPEHHHVMVGEGRERHRRGLVRSISSGQNDASERVHWLGQRTDLDALFAASDFLIDSAPLPGGLVKIQAMASGLPMVAVHHPVYPLWRTGALDDDYPLAASSGEDVVALSRRLIHDPGLRSRVARSLVERHAQRFSPPVLTAALGRLLGPDGGPEPRILERPTYELDYLAGLDGPVPSAGALRRRAKVRLDDPSLRVRDRALRAVDLGLMLIRGTGRS
jgi:glycosyltransferase involved in cell wall biosynthesis